MIFHLISQLEGYYVFSLELLMRLRRLYLASMRIRS